MKVRKLEKKEYIAVAASLILVTAVGLGVSVDKTEKQNAELSQKKTVQAGDDVATVDASKNETAQADMTDATENAPVAQADITEATENAPVAQADTTKKADATPVEQPDAEEPTAQSYDDEFEEAGVSANEIKMEWPLIGEIAMDYSADTMVYDPTLDQYRTNDTVCILADEGSPVKAASDGTVTEVTNDYEKGYTVVIKHQDGWSTTYSQLSENVAVAVGDTVKKGQKIGQVAKPTKYGSAMGPHLEFKVCQGEFAIDPKVALGEQN
ncbi:MAG TPA: hypothetical protein DIC60_10695 [Lachnospiraceae bacterium]|nr:hypothetical protein [Lachnospiraceae bacterium]